jgi:ATP-dependent DNA helicase DinG
MKELPLARAVEKVFRESLPIELGPSFESRPDQLDMALVVAAAIENGQVSLLEAETGLGKSLAYLVPLILHCARSGDRAVVSTYTRNLQNQLLSRDFPAALRVAGMVLDGAEETDGAVLMGRSNYACRFRLEKVEKSKKDDPEMTRWLRTRLETQGGELDLVSDSVSVLETGLRPRIACPGRDAVCAGCRLRADCFMLRARRRANKSQVVFVNHALLFSDFAASGALLGNYDILVLDEAHHVEDVATDFYTLSYSPRSVRGAAHSIYDPAYEETVAYIRALVAASSEDEAKTVDKLWAAFHKAMSTADTGTAELFTRLGQNAEKMSLGSSDRRTGRFAGPAQVVFQEGAPLFYNADSSVSDVRRALITMEKTASELSEIINSVPALEESGVNGAMGAIGGVAAETRAQFEFLTGGSAEDHVFYARLDDSSAVTSLAASPIEMSFRLGAALEENCRTTILTSATLAIRGDFSYFLDRYGLAGSSRVETRRYESPFDLAGNRMVVLPSFLPGPEHRLFLDGAASLVSGLSAAFGKRIMVLCTARGQVEALESLIQKHSGDHGRRKIYSQKDGNSRVELLEKFRRSRNGILIGLASFWEGIDLPGDELEILVILKLPFLVPTEPVTQARCLRLAETGDNPFEKLFVPDVILKLRQGMGRLIRTGHDRGAVIILDGRLLRNAYGETVLAAVTGGYGRFDNMEETIKALRSFFGS